MERDCILIVDCDASAWIAHTCVLEAMGFNVDRVSDAEAAFRYLEVRPQSRLVISEWNAAGIDGGSLLHYVSQNYPELPVVFRCAEQSAPAVLDGFRAGAFDFLWKTCSTEELEAVAGAALEHGRMRRQSLLYRKNLEGLISERTAKLRATMMDLERSYDVTLEAMGDALDLRDAETEGHCRRVTAYTVALARAIGVPAQQVKTIARGAFLHDIGKIAIPDSILLKPGKLTPDEMSVMREHCRKGYQMVAKIPFLADAAEIVYAHQEAFDGSGYPRGLRGDEIPLGARIFALADTLDAITSDRPYRKGKSFAEAIGEIESCAGTQFDPGIVRVFLSVPVSKWKTIREETDRTSLATQPLDLFHAVAA